MEQQQKISGSIFDWPLLKRIIGLARPYRKYFMLASVLAITLALLAPLRPYLIQFAVDNYVMLMNKQGLINITLMLVGLLLVESVLQYGFIFITSWLGQSVIRNLRVRVFGHVVGLRLQYFDRTPIGTVTTRTINDVETINDIFSQGLVQIVADLLTIVAIITFMMFTNWKLTLVSLATFPLLIYSTYVFKESIKSSFQKVRNQVAKLNAFTQEHITGMRIIQIFNAQKREEERFQQINKEHMKAHMQSIWYYSIFFPVVEVILASALGLMVWYGANRVIHYETTVGTLIAFILYINMLFRPLRMIADKFNTLQMGMVASERVFALLDKKETIENNGSHHPDTIQGDVRFEQVWFAYEEENYVLKGVDFHIKPGETLAIVGATGSGKSSIINILNRFYEIQKGSIKVDGVDIKEFELAGLRKHIGMVLQDVFLFSGTVMENITLRDTDITRDQVIAAAKAVGAHDFIMRLPGGYDYKVMERGATLSMGQRQLISFIRALVFNPAILILDEATSSIDTESEMIIQQAIDKMVAGRTSIVIAHRLSTIQKADKIMVLDKGEIKEVGTHEQLLQHNGYYRKLYDMQFKQSLSA